MNPGVANLRSRLWSGGSTLSMWRAKSRPGRPSATTAPSASNAFSMSLERSGWLSASRAASYPTTEERAVAVDERDVVDGPLLEHVREQRERVVPVVVAPLLEGGAAGLAHATSRNPEHTRSIRKSRPFSPTDDTQVWVSARGEDSGSNPSR